MRKLSHFYSPQDDLSKKMLASIPTKVAAWASNLGVPLSKGALGNLTWRIKRNEGVSVLVINEEDPIQIDWNGKPGEVHNVRANISWVENISMNLERFIALEKKIYDQFEEVERQRLAEAERNFQALQAARG